MEKLHKRITGKSAETYVWQERERTRVPEPRKQRVSRVFGLRLVFGNDLRSRIAPWITMFIAVVMISMILGKVSYVMNSYKEMESLEKNNNNLINAINAHEREYELDSRAHIIAQEATLRLGMISPEEEDTMVFATVKKTTPDQTLAAGQDS